MDVRVDEAGHHHAVPRVEHLAAGGDRLRIDQPGEAAALDQDGRGARAVRADDPPAHDGKIGHLGQGATSGP